MRFQSGDHAAQVYNEHGTVVIGGHSVSEIRQIALDATRAEVLPEARRIAGEIIEERFHAATDMVLVKMLEKDPELLSRFSDPRFLAPLVSAQRSYAETGDDELGSILAGLLTDLAGEPTRNRREIVLREAIECAPKLTSQHLSALSVIFLLSRFSFSQSPNVSHLLELLNEFYSPYYETIPSSTFEYQYMGATAAGTLLAFGASPYKSLHQRHPNSMYDYLSEDEIASAFDGKVSELSERLKSVLTAPRPKEPGEPPQIKLKSDAAARILNSSTKSESDLDEFEKTLRNLIRAKSIKSSEFKAEISSQYPELAAFLDRLEQTSALDFHLSPVGMMLARHEIVSRTPEMTDQIDSMFAD
ncbi:MAG: hypothetical protein CME34_01305 [Gordonia sp.]|uniref:LPO_1073/Vpar_1526 family protein n=1 Tax=Gordonia sp. (in: high G+C Gram-positive bacteria) TaxID=84139 RepID=UPI000C433AC7|nr:LPO_1073/Vpar_1526 family protein [Gordonia sp. (in: high G+C Gram-positive bacteria)]MAU80514.1 hypothetical protein [Gordonia sp. (in: high G+C Gram-positive bacteria)]